TSSAAHGVPAPGARRGDRVRLARCEGPARQGQGRNVGARAGIGSTGNRGGGWRPAVCRREPRAQTRRRAGSGVGTRERQISAAVRGRRETRGGTGPGNGPRDAGTARHVVGRGEEDEGRLGYRGPAYV